MPEIIRVFSTSGTREIAVVAFEAMKAFLAETQRGKNWVIDFGETRIDRFSNENQQVRVVTNVRDAHVVIFHTQTPPVHIQLWELFLTIQAIRGAKAKTISIAFPYMPYCRSDLRTESRVSVGAQLIPQFCKVLGINSVLLVEPHDGHVELFYDPIADKIPLAPLIAGFIKKHVLLQSARDCWTVVFPDAGASKRFEDMPVRLGLTSAVIQKSRPNHKEQPEAKRVVGQVKGQHCIMIDDEILTGSTLVRDTELLLKEGAKSVRVYAAHGILAKTGVPDSELIQMLEDSPITQIGVCDTVPVAHKLSLQKKGKIVVMPAIELIGQAAARMIVGEPISVLHEYSRYL